MKTYTIEAGNHYANGINVKPWIGKTQYKFKALFDESCLYDLGNYNNKDINKLAGLTFSWWNDDNSVRIGWNCSLQNGKVQLFGYFHKGGVIDYLPLGQADVNTFVEFYIDIDRPAGTIWITSSNIGFAYPTSFNFSGVPKYGYYNYPYFGGDETAPHDMQITIID